MPWTAPLKASRPSSSGLSTRTGAPRCLVERADEILAVRALTPRCGHHGLDVCRAGLPGDAGERPDEGCGLGDLLLGEPAEALDLGAEPERRLLLAQRLDPSVVTTGEQEPHRVRAHVDDADVHHAILSTASVVVGKPLVSDW